ncbi:hypothetical protein K438DRAFT_1758405 [Mycena galopus ATCC 62051]|nr:hypothetical protein K438DRAFT_1758405 [Mycena galopus ATCC 62051]
MAPTLTIASSAETFDFNASSTQAARFQASSLKTPLKSLSVKPLKPSSAKTAAPRLKPLSLKCLFPVQTSLGEIQDAQASTSTPRLQRFNFKPLASQDSSRWRCEIYNKPSSIKFKTPQASMQYKTSVGDCSRRLDDSSFKFNTSRNQDASRLKTSTNFKIQDGQVFKIQDSILPSPCAVIVAGRISGADLRIAPSTQTFDFNASSLQAASLQASRHPPSLQPSSHSRPSSFKRQDRKSLLQAASTLSVYFQFKTSIQDECLLFKASTSTPRLQRLNFKPLTSQDSIRGRCEIQNKPSSIKFKRPQASRKYKTSVGDCARRLDDSSFKFNASRNQDASRLKTFSKFKIQDPRRSSLEDPRFKTPQVFNAQVFKLQDTSRPQWDTAQDISRLKTLQDSRHLKT